MASEIRANFEIDEDDEKESWILLMWYLCIVSTVCLIFSIISKGEIFIRWMKSKRIFTDLDNFYNTGILYWVILESLSTLVMPYPSLYDSVYYESANELSAGIPF